MKTKQCKTCIHRWSNGGILPPERVGCLYILDEGHRRPAAENDICPAYVCGKEKNRRDKDNSELFPIMPESQRAKRVREFCEQLKAMHAEGYNDHEIARELRCTYKKVQYWRRKMNLSAIPRGKCRIDQGSSGEKTQKEDIG